MNNLKSTQTATLYRPVGQKEQIQIGPNEDGVLIMIALLPDVRLACREEAKGKLVGAFVHVAIICGGGARPTPSY